MSVESVTEYPVYLKVYDLSHGMAAAISEPLLGFKLEAIYHTAIAIYGNEYFFGSFPAPVWNEGISPRDGILYYEEKRCERITGHPLIKKIKLGTTEISEDIFHEYIETLKEQFSPDKYNLLKWNCNNFTNIVSEFLIGTGIPEEYVTFVDKINSTPNGNAILGLIQQTRNQVFNIPGRS